MNRLTKSKAMQISGLSRHVFDKLLTEGTLVLHIAEDDKKYIHSIELDEFMQTNKYHELLHGTVDPKNNLSEKKRKKRNQEFSNE